MKAQVSGVAELVSPQKVRKKLDLEPDRSVGCREVARGSTACDDAKPPLRRDTRGDVLGVHRARRLEADESELEGADSVESSGDAGEPFVDRFPPAKRRVSSIVAERVGANLRLGSRQRTER